MQRIIAAICATILIAFTAAGCSKDDKKAGEKGAPVDDQAAGVDKGTTTPTPTEPAATGTPDKGTMPADNAAEPMNEGDDEAVEGDDYDDDESDDEGEPDKAAEE